ncbi:MAG: very short patch repair endonuclease [Gammaproteobacteria bacterium]|nr:very short patch repair endonuclease [Gammaproteobacteria bacterium]MBU1655235.1 very short patch repair endonuclease [Gammaproteobacteria bacterium]MBU1961336.1 very short patch repair endonuclease [Gammaproteobacteria bacterium]
MDTISAEKRSNNMRRIRSENTAPELRVRRLAYSIGYRYRLHYKKLPGKPDLVFIGRKKVIFVHGCFWHGHICKKGQRRPKSNQIYWTTKINSNINRDLKTRIALNESGWKVLVLWECELTDLSIVEQRIRNFLDT